MIFILFFLASYCFAESSVPTTKLGTLEINIEGTALPIGYTLRFPPGKKFNSSQPTVIYINGGPMPFAESAPFNIPNIFPDNIQVMVVDYIGTRRNNKNFPSLKAGQILAHLNATGQAEAIRDVIKKEKLQKYIIWGTSLGASISLRAINAIQNDSSIKAKPIAAVLDSGSGRQVTKADLEWSAKCSREKPQPPATQKVKCAPPPGFLSGTLSSYLRDCYPDRPAPDRVSMLITRLVNYSFPEDPSFIKQFLGCPPIKQVDYSVWAYSMACGGFDSEAAKTTLNYCHEKCNYPVCGEAQETCRKRCADLPRCKDSPVDVRKMNLGKTAVLGIQARDDCNSWPATMDYLMNNLSSQNSDYVSVPRGGHVSYQPRNRESDLWKACHDNPAPIFSNLFRGSVKEAGQILRRCYTGHSKNDESASTVK